MIPKEKALELCDAFYQYLPLEHNVITTEGDLSWEYDGWKNAKQCALIAVDEILNANQIWYENTIPHKYWQQVKEEIRNL
jgi:hypothetical protein